MHTNAAPVGDIYSKSNEGRIVCMFFIKWLTIADNEFTDKGIANADDTEKQKFASILASNLDTISKAQQYALASFLVDKIDLLERKLDNHSEEIKTTLHFISADVSAIKETCIQITEQNPEMVKTFIQSQTKEIESLLIEVEKSLHSIDQVHSNSAKKWREQLLQGLSVTADIVGSSTFISGIPSLPTLVNSS